MLANNIANSETGGYKTDREFYNIYTSVDAAGVEGQDPDALPVIEKNYTDFSQGVVRPTTNPLDFAIQGKGFFSREFTGGCGLHAQRHLSDFRCRNAGYCRRQRSARPQGQDHHARSFRCL